MQGAGADEGEVGDQGAELGPALHPAQQIGVVGVGLEDDRRALALGIVHEQVHLVLGEAGFRHGKGQGAGAAGLLLEVVDVFEDVPLHFLEVLGHLGVILVFFHQVFDVWAHRGQGDVLVQLPFRLLELLFHAPDLGDGLVHLGVQGIGALAQGLPLLIAQGLELLFGHGLAFFAGEEHEAGVGDVQDKAFLVGPGVELLEDGVAFLGELAHQGFPAVVVLLALKDLGDVDLEIGEEFLHVGLEGAPPAGGQDQAPGPLRLLEIVDVEIVRGAGLLGRQLADVILDGLGFPGVAGPGHVNVIFVVLDAEPEFQGPLGPVLGHDLEFQGRQI